MALPGNPLARLNEYDLRHLAGHLAAAGRDEDLHRLLALETTGQRHAWHEAKEALGDLEGFLADVELAWKLAGAEHRTRGSSVALGRECRYALISSSLNSLTTGISPTLLATVVVEGVWSPALGLAYARRIPTAVHLAAALEELIPHLPGELKEEALAEVQAVADEHVRATTILQMVPHLSKQLTEKALLMVHALRSEKVRAETLALVASHLPEDLRNETLQAAAAAAMSIEYEADRVQVFTAIAPHLPESLLPQVLGVIQTIEDEHQRVGALAELIPYLPDGHRDEVLRAELAAMGVPEGADALANPLIQLGPSLPRELLQEALRVALAMEAGDLRAATLELLARRSVENGIPSESLATLQAIEDTKWRAAALADATAQLVDLGHYDEALSASQAIDDDSYRARAYWDLPFDLQEALGEAKLADVQAIEEEDWRVAAQAFEDIDRWPEALARVIPYLPSRSLDKVLAVRLAYLEYDSAVDWLDELLAEALLEALLELSSALVEAGNPEQALAVVLAIEDEERRAAALAGLAPRLPEESLKEALEAARSMESEEHLAAALAGLVPYLPLDLLLEVLDVARAVKDEVQRSRALAMVAPHLPEGQREGVLREAMETAQVVGDALRQVRALAGLARYLPMESLAEALAVIRTVETIDSQPEILYRLACQLADLHRPAEALAATQAVDDEDWRETILERLASRLADLEHPAQALAAAQAIENSPGLVRTLTALVSQLPEPHRSEALQDALAAARTIEAEENRAKALVDLAPYLPEHVRLEAFAAARAIEEEHDRAEVLARLAAHLPPEPAENALREALALVLATDDPYERTGWLTSLLPHLPEHLLVEALLPMEGSEWIGRLARAVGQRVPPLASRAEQVMRRRALVVAYPTEGERWKAVLLPALARRMTELGYPGETLAAIREVGDTQLSWRMLRDLIPNLPGELVPEALPLAYEIQDETTHDSTLRRLARRLADLDQPEEALATVQAIEDDEAQTRGWFSLALDLARRGHFEAAEVAMQQVEEEEEDLLVEAWGRVSPYLPPDRLAESLSEFLEIEDEFWQSAFLTRTACGLAEHGRLEEALVAVRMVQDEDRASALDELDPFLPEALPSEALGIALEIEDESAREGALAALVPHLPEGTEEGTMRDVLAAIWSTTYASEWAQTLAKLIPRLPQHLQVEALEDAAGATRIEGYRAELLANLAPHLDELPKAALHSLCHETLQHLARGTRGDLMLSLRALAPAINTLGGPEALMESFHAIQDVARWWP